MEILELQGCIQSHDVSHVIGGEVLVNLLIYSFWGGLLVKKWRTARSGGTPNGIRTRVTAVKGRRPSPLDDGGI